MGRRLLSQVHPLFYFLSVWEKRIRRCARWYFGGQRFSATFGKAKLAHRVKKHQSVLLKKLGVLDMQLQYNKVTNLRIAMARISGLLIRPGETFSFCKRVGFPTRRKGYLPGMELSFGQARAGIGGGICQISNLIYWLALHSPLTVVERHHHSFDPFPDDGRVLPFASGATVFYNYLDLQFTNRTPHTFQINLWLSQKCLEGELRVDSELAHSYHVYEREHAFLKRGEEFFRKNELWRDTIDKRISRVVKSELVVKNFAEVKYVPAGFAARAPLRLPLARHLRSGDVKAVPEVDCGDGED